jgi:hypothetical protein
LIIEARTFFRVSLTAAQEEFDMAVTFHEIWKPAAYDQELHSRFGKSYATQAFLVTRTALRRDGSRVDSSVGHKPAGHQDAIYLE